MQTKGGRFNDIEIDLETFFSVIWGKIAILFVFLLLALLSSVLSLRYSTTYFTATAVIEENNNKGSDMSVSQSIAGFMNNTNSTNPLVSAFSPQVQPLLVQTIMGKEFLKELVKEKKELQPYLKKFCRYAPPKFFSLDNFLSLLGVYKINKPDKTQLKDLQINCIQNMLGIDRFKINKINTSAYSLSIKSSDPVFSAMMVNGILDQYIVTERSDRRKQFNKTVNIMSKNLGVAQLDLNEARSKLELFIRESVSLIGSVDRAATSGIDPTDIGYSNTFLFIVQKEITELTLKIGEIEKYQKKLLLTLEALLKFYDRSDKTEITFFNIQNSVVGLSRGFLAYIENLTIEDANSEDEKRVLSKKIKDEINNIETLIGKNEENIKALDSRSLKLMEIENKFKDLIVNVSTKSFLYNALQAQLSAKSVKEGEEALNDPILHSRAIVPLNPSHPKRFLTVVLFCFIFLAMGILFIFLRQSSLKIVYNTRQLRKNGVFENVIGFSKKKFSLKSNFENKHWDNISPFNLDLMETLLNDRKKISIINLTEKNKIKTCSTHEVSESIGNNLALAGLNVVCVLASQGEDGLIADKRNLKDQGESTFKLQNGKTRISVSKSLTLGNKLFDFDDINMKFEKQILSIGANVKDYIKFQAIKECDFYLLVGNAGKFSEERLSNFCDNVGNKKTKCVGCILLS